MEKINTVVVGYGGMGKYHADNIEKFENFNLVGIYDIKEERCELARENNVKAYESFEAVLADDKVELIVCATYNDCHKDIAIRAMKAGKNVISEKPVTMCSEDLADMIKVSEETGKLFTVHQNRRWDNDYRTIKNIIDKNELGKVFAIDSRVYGSRGIPGDWRQEKEHGGGMVFDWGVHLLDQILMINEGKTIESVYATVTHITNDDVPAIMPTAEPKPPIRLITALPSERSSGGVKSGIRATTGARHNDIENTNNITTSIVSGSAKSPLTLSATNGISANNTAEIGAQETINGRRLPNFEWQLSESLPKVG